MRKLIILKSLVDFIWIITCIPLLFLMGFFLVYMFVEPEALDIVFDEISFDKTIPNYIKQFFGLLFIIITSISVYCLFVFRKTLRYFQQVKPFHIDVINNFHKIGYMLCGIGIGGTLIAFASRILFKGEFIINLGITPYLVLTVLGLFFMVLSEVFKVAKHAKEENELTV
ncbi:DUF2975 domain-containing protein [Winogradskyella vincentii]|uniref:DUF2975 domain-containing protein n=1 Tax=Winogradskyella vincentii TaxID=2877122 RepID=A0ABS7XYW3_9FLAO|nr:DUF2975 domain-containing protein [Winogradskyella vincentii]MCA0152234.1 DUF2975 domain-containing protein [Winogradskyella vincentii]